MLDLSRFSNVLSQFGANFPIQNTLGQPKPASLSIPQAPKTPEKDSFSFSPVGSNVVGSSFDRREHTPLVAPSEPPPISVNSDGTYRPPQIQFNSSLNFAFSASLSRATVVQRPNLQGGSLVSDRTSSQFSYQTSAYSERSNIGGSFGEVRRFQTDMFFSRTRTLSQNLSPETGQQLESTGRKVARQFEIEISLDASFLRQFNVQTEGLADDEDMLGQYLDNADGLAGLSGEALQAFFNEVDQILADTESFVKDSLGSFLTDVKAAFGLNDAEADDLTHMVISEVQAFFKDVDAFLSDARNAVLAPEETSGALPEDVGAAALVA
ncbi:MAG: hypothetical protein ACO36I_05265 [Candidatus Latescibacterota bacterium]